MGAGSPDEGARGPAPSRRLPMRTSPVGRGLATPLAGGRQRVRGESGVDAGIQGVVQVECWVRREMRGAPTSHLSPAHVSLLPCAHLPSPLRTRPFSPAHTSPLSPAHLPPLPCAHALLQPPNLQQVAPPSSLAGSLQSLPSPCWDVHFCALFPALGLVALTWETGLTSAPPSRGLSSGCCVNVQ